LEVVEGKIVLNDLSVFVGETEEGRILEVVPTADGPQIVRYRDDKTQPNHPAVIAKVMSQYRVEYDTFNQVVSRVGKTPEIVSMPALKYTLFQTPGMNEYYDQRIRDKAQELREQQLLEEEKKKRRQDRPTVKKKVEEVKKRGKQKKKK